MIMKLKERKITFYLSIKYYCATFTPHNIINFKILLMHKLMYFPNGPTEIQETDQKKKPKESNVKCKPR